MDLKQLVAGNLQFCFSVEHWAQVALAGLVWGEEGPFPPLHSGQKGPVKGKCCLAGPVE